MASIYHHKVPTKTIDVYRVLVAFEVTDPCIQHAIKKLLAAGKRIGGKTIAQDVAEALWSLQRWQEMRVEEDEQRAVVDHFVKKMRDGTDRLRKKMAGSR